MKAYRGFNELLADALSRREAFSDTRYRKFQWNRHSITNNAPEGSGIFGLYNAMWIYVGEANNLRAYLLELLTDDDSPVAAYRPSGFAFELASEIDRCRRQRELLDELQPLAQKKSFRAPAGSVK